MAARRKRKGKEKRRRGFVACVAVSLLFCITPVGRQACSLYYAFVAARRKRKGKKKRRRSFAAFVAVGFKLVVLYYACGAASL